MALDLHRRNANNEPVREEITEEIVNSRYPKDPLQLLGERSFGNPKELDSDEVGTPIQEFFRNKTIFLTGGTGFMGKILVEKLLRSCPHVKRIYLLIRPKRGKDIQERLETVFKDRLFWRLRTLYPAALSKVSVVSGDCACPGIGLSESDRSLLVDNVQVIFHCAATIKLNEHIKMAVKINVIGVQDMLRLAREMVQLQAFVHVSTAFSHCPRTEIHEEFYPMSVEYEALIERISTLDNEKLEEMTPSILGKWPNTYTFTKALAEKVIQNEAKGLPLAILRPTVVISTYKEPVRGWIDNVYGPIGIMVGICTGVIHTQLLNLDSVTDMVPVDLVVNCLLAVAWSINETQTKEDPPIYNFVSSTHNSITWKQFIAMFERELFKWPTIKAVWYYFYCPTTSRTLYFVLSFLLHTIPGTFLDALLKLKGKRPMLCAIYNKLDKALEMLENFANQQWVWTNRNVGDLFNKLTAMDQELFYFDIGQMSWEYMFETLWLGLRVYLVKEDINTLPIARRKWQRLRIAHQSLKIVFIIVAFASLYTIIHSSIV